MMALTNIKSLALLAWVLVNALLALAIGSELGWGEKLYQSMPVPVVHSSAPVEVALDPDFRLPAREKTYAVTLERPLFVPSRSPAPPAPSAPSAPPPTMQKGQFQLLGTIITDEMRIAVVKEISSGKERQIVQGYTINGLQLEKVEADRIVFTQYDDREEIRLKIQRSSKPVAKPVAAPQRGQPARLQAAPATPTRPAAPAQGASVPAGRIERPAAIIFPPQTVEDRKNDPLLKDFYK
jgi:type II secretory pathway component PulC